MTGEIYRTNAGLHRDSRWRAGFLPFKPEAAARGIRVSPTQEANSRLPRPRGW